MKASLFALAALGLAACTSQPRNDASDAASHSLVLYYSQFGATRTVALELQSQVGADIAQVEATPAYDGDFQQTIARCQQEAAEGTLPELKPLDVDLARYDTIYLGYPIWFGTYATPIAALVKQEAFEGKTVIPFCTFGSGGLQASSRQLAEALPQANVLEGYGVRTVRVEAAPAELNRFLIERGYKAGEIEALPAFMEAHPVTADEAAIFDQACSSYQYPMGTPVSVAVRATEAATDYLFTAASQGPDGQEQTSEVYVTVANAEGAVAEFTQVVR